MHHIVKKVREYLIQGRPPTILVVGDVIRDVYFWGKVDRISPEAPVPVFFNSEQSQTLGGAANVAANLRALGCEVYLLGVVGADASGGYVHDLIRQRGINDKLLLTDPSRPTTEKTRLLASQQQLLRMDQESRESLSPILISRLLDMAGSLMGEIDGVVCSDYEKGVCTPELLEPLFAKARAAGCPIFVDPKVRDFSLYRGATVLTPNLIEVERAAGVALAGVALEGPVALTAAVDILLQKSQAHAMLVTMGKDGMTLFHPPRSPLHVPARAREVFDVTGAGDTVIAVFSIAVLCGFSLIEATHLANTAASIVVSKVGTSVVSPEELLRALQDESLFGDRKVLRHDELAVALQRRRQRGERIGFTNGCFDLLHVGHIQSLQQARALVDCLVVALNDDASVRRLKGDRRPLISQDERARILEALACVDYVTIFSDATPLPLLHLSRPDVLFKGGDYTLDTVVGREEVEAYGGEVYILPYMTGVSTTEIINSVVERYS